MLGQKLLIFSLVALALGGQVSATDNFCQGCRSLVSHLRSFNSSNQRDEYKDVFRNYCELYYPTSTDYQQGPCPLFVEGLFYVIDHTNPIDHCDKIGACDFNHNQKITDSLQPSDDIYEYIRNSNNIKLQAGRGDNVICEFCEQMVDQAKRALSDPATIDQVKSQMDAFCEYLKVIEQDKECRQFIDKYIDQAISFIQTINPKEYCQTIQLCSVRAKESTRMSSKEKTSANDLTNLPSLTDFQNFGIETSVIIGTDKSKLATGVKVGPTCMLCKTVVKTMFEFLHDNRTEENIVYGLERVCGLIYSPGTNRDQCDSMVKAYTRELIQLMIDETDPEVICMLIGQCAHQNAAFKYETFKAPSRPATDESNEFGLSDLITALDESIEYKSIAACVECKMFIKFLKQELGEPKSQDELKQWLLNNLCKELPESDLVNSCSNMIEKNANVFFKALAGLLNPHTACAELGVCNARSIVSVFNFGKSQQLTALPMNLSPSKLDQANKILNRPREFGGQMCDQCVEIVSQIDDYLSKHPIDQDVSIIIDKVCNNLPEGTARGECTYIIKTFGTEIVQAISTMDNPRQLCSKIYLCQANKV